MARSGSLRDDAAGRTGTTPPGFPDPPHVPPKDLFNDALDVFVTLEDDYCSDGFCYFVEITTPKFLSTMMEKGNSTFLEPGYPYIIVSKLTDDIIRTAIESFINPKDFPDDDELRWLKFYHVIPKLTTEEIDEILNRKM